MTEDWLLWITASLSDYFNTIATENDIPFYVESTRRDSAIDTYAELKLDGPYFNEVNKHNWQVDVFIAILVQVLQDSDDIYKIQRYYGKFADAFKTDIPIYKMPGDETYFNCLRLDPSTGEKIRGTQYGQIQQATRVNQASIEAHYIMSFQES